MRFDLSVLLLYMLYWLSSRSLFLILLKSSSTTTRIFLPDSCWAINLVWSIIFDTKLDNLVIECDLIIWCLYFSTSLSLSLWVLVPCGKMFDHSYVYFVELARAKCSFWALTYLPRESMQQKWPVNILTFSLLYTKSYGLWLIMLH